MAILVHWQRGNLTHPKLIAVRFLIRSEGHWKPHNQVECQSLTEHISEIRVGNPLILRVMRYPTTLLPTN